MLYYLSHFFFPLSFLPFSHAFLLLFFLLSFPVSFPFSLLSLFSPAFTSFFIPPPFPSYLLSCVLHSIFLCSPFSLLRQSPIYVKLIFFTTCTSCSVFFTFPFKLPFSIFLFYVKLPFSIFPLILNSLSPFYVISRRFSRPFCFKLPSFLLPFTELVLPSSPRHSALLFLLSHHFSLSITLPFLPEPRPSPLWASPGAGSKACKVSFIILHPVLYLKSAVCVGWLQDLYTFLFIYLLCISVCFLFVYIFSYFFIFYVCICLLYSIQHLFIN